MLGSLKELLIPLRGACVTGTFFVHFIYLFILLLLVVTSGAFFNFFSKVLMVLPSDVNMESGSHCWIVCFGKLQKIAAPSLMSEKCGAGRGFQELFAHPTLSL